MQTTYTVIRPSGSIDADGLDLISAVQWLLGYDGHDFELRPHVNDGAYALFVSRMSHNSGGGNGGMVRADIPPAFAQNEEDAWPIIAAAVLRAHRRWKGCEIMTDAEYAAIQADHAADRRIADHIDGYDRDDLGESPDF